MSRPIHQSLKRPAQCVQEYVGEASDAYKSWLTILACCTCDPCLCCKIDDIKKSTYVAVWENKMEFNYPEFHCCCMVRGHGTHTPRRAARAVSTLRASAARVGCEAALHRPLRLSRRQLPLLQRVCPALPCRSPFVWLRVAVGVWGRVMRNRWIRWA